MYYIVYGILYIFSLLPLRVLYLFSDFAYYIVYYLVGYRKKVVFTNLQQAFPEKSEGERLQLTKKFYHNFTDSFIETIKLMSAGNSFIKARMQGDFSVLDKLFEEGRKCQIYTSHNFNWEYANVGCALQMKQTMLTVYMPINNKIFDRLFKKLRSKTGAVLLPATRMKNAMIPYRDTLYALALVADQNPGHPKNALWFNFFGKPAPFVGAPESGARRGNIPVVFSHYIKKKRGFYEVSFSLASENSGATKRGEITRKYVSFLEAGIRANPDLWLWSHRRWKWEWKEGYGEVM